MRYSRGFAFLPALACAGIALAGGMATPPRIDDPVFQATVLAGHNAERRTLGVPDLVWSPSLAGEARDWAAELAKTGKMAHERQSKHGENIAASPIGRADVPWLVALWLAEKPRYIPGSAHPNTSSTGNWADVGHYTAVVWSATREVGCAVGRGQAYDFLVCRYNPAGNVKGYAAYDVNVAKAAAIARAVAPPVAAAPAAVPAAKKKPADPAKPAPVPTPKPATVAG